MMCYCIYRRNRDLRSLLTAALVALAVLDILGKGQPILLHVVTEMEFFDVNLTKDSSLFLHAIHSLFYWRIYREPNSTLVFKTHTKKSAKQENSSLFMNKILKNRKTRVKSQTKTRVFSMPRNLD
jgi:hypothetical protein